MKENMETRGTSPESAAEFKMIDIGAKADTHRRALASGKFFAAPATLSRIRERSLPKGDVLTLAEVAGIQGAKRTADLLPLCHPLPLTSVRVWCEPALESISVFCEAKTIGKTGVEMEALSGVSAALLCIYDLTKGIDPVLRIGEIQLEIKEGGKSGFWKRPEVTQDHHPTPPALTGVRSIVLTLSDRCARGETQDASGPAARDWLESHGAQVVGTQILPDDAHALKTELIGILERDPSCLIVTSGGTGLSPRDITPETVLALASEVGGREIPGFGELLRQSGAKHVATSWLSRSLAVTLRSSVILCLPGKPKAVIEGLEAVGHLIPHALHTARGGDHR